MFDEATLTHWYVRHYIIQIIMFPQNYKNVFYRRITDVNVTFKTIGETRMRKKYKKTKTLSCYHYISYYDLQ